MVPQYHRYRSQGRLPHTQQHDRRRRLNTPSRCWRDRGGLGSPRGRTVGVETWRVARGHVAQRRGRETRDTYQCSRAPWRRREAADAVAGYAFCSFVYWSRIYLQGVGCSVGQRPCRHFDVRACACPLSHMTHPAVLAPAHDNGRGNRRTCRERTRMHHLLSLRFARVVVERHGLEHLTVLQRATEPHQARKRGPACEAQMSVPRALRHAARRHHPHTKTTHAPRLSHARRATPESCASHRRCAHGTAPHRPRG